MDVLVPNNHPISQGLEPNSPIQGAVWYHEDDGYIWAYIYWDNRWCEIVDMSTIKDEYTGDDIVQITFDPNEEIISDVTDCNNYLYRIGL